MTARIYLPARNAMQSGQAKTEWILEFDKESPRQIEPLMGWTSSTETRTQVRLRFDTQEEAVAYATRAGLAYKVEAPKPATRKLVSYSDNFRAGRLVPWSH